MAEPHLLESQAAITLALTDEQVRTVRRIVDIAVPSAEFFVFGSRATGRARPFSDLDLLFVTPARLTWAQRAELRDQFEACTLPFSVDVVDADGLAPGMLERVMRERVRLA